MDCDRLNCKSQDRDLNNENNRSDKSLTPKVNRNTSTTFGQPV